MENKGRQAYTLDDIARELGVSKTTVSRAISGKGRIGAETRTRVLRLIESRGFRPNAVAKSLAQNRTHNLALALPGGQTLDFGFFRRIVMGICAVASRNDYDVLLSTDEEQLRRILANGKADGVIAARSEVRSPVVAMLRERDMPFVLIGPSADPAVLSVDNDNRGACEALTARLLARGVRRMALLGGDEGHFVTRSRRQGFEDAHRKAGLAWEEKLMFSDLLDSGAVGEAGRASLARGAECLVCMDDVLCQAALNSLHDAAVSVPGDVQLACFYDSDLLAHMVPAVTAVRFDASALGEAACQTLLERLETGSGESRVLPEYWLMLRDSTNSAPRTG